MSRAIKSRRTFLAGSTGVVASAALAAGASGQSAMVINDPTVVQEVETAFRAYYRALAQNDVNALNELFFESPLTIRYGAAENLYGHAEIKAYRATITAPAEPKLERTVITTFGRDFAMASTLNRRSAERVGRTTQTWVRFPQGWRIVAAHVSTIDEPRK